MPQDLILMVDRVEPPGIVVCELETTGEVFNLPQKLFDRMPREGMVFRVCGKLDTKELKKALICGASLPVLYSEELTQARKEKMLKMVQDIMGAP